MSKIVVLEEKYSDQDLSSCTSINVESVISIRRVGKAWHTLEFSQLAVWKCMQKGYGNLYVDIRRYITYHSVTALQKVSIAPTAPPEI